METLVMVIGLMAVTVACVALGERWKLPYPILMLLASAGIACIPWLPTLEIDHELILPLFLPPLLFATAQRTDWSVFVTRWPTLLVLAVCLTAGAVAGATLLLVPGIAVPLALMLGAMVAPPDPVAVEAVAGPAKMPRRLLSMLQTEGLFNDAGAIVLFSAALSALTGTGTLGLGIAADFVIGAVIAVAIGFFLGFLYRMTGRVLTSTAARTAMSVVVPFAAYILAEELHASGVIAVVVTALETKRRARAEDSEARISRATFWDVATLLVTGIAFGLLGMQLREVVVEEGWGVLEYLPVALLICVLVIAIRVVAMLVIRPVARLDAGEVLGWQDSVVLTWCGMRGLATLALALAVPSSSVTGADASYRNMVVVVACTVLLVTLVPPGLGLGRLLKLLGRQDDGSIAETVVQELSLRARAAAMEAIRERFEESEELSDRELAALKGRFSGLNRELDTATRAMAGLTPEGQQPDPELRRKVEEKVERRAKGRELMATAQTVGLDAARGEVLQARSERGVDPEAADQVLRQLDLMMLASPPRVRGGR